MLHVLPAKIQDNPGNTGELTGMSAALCTSVYRWAGEPCTIYFGQWFL